MFNKPLKIIRSTNWYKLITFGENIIKMKVENTKRYTDEECNEINNSHKELGFNFQIEK